MNKVIEALRLAGFVRVDGLMYTSVGSSQAAIVPKDCGDDVRISYNNGKTAIAMPDGSVWLGLQHTQPLTQAFAIAELPISRGGTFVPFSNGEDIRFSDILQRLTDPQWLPEYHRTPEAIKAGF
jgi:hypothetical protein